MEYTNKQLQKIYLDAVDNQVSNKELLPIAKQLTAVCRRIQYSSSDLRNAIDVLEDLHNQGVVDKVDDKLLNLFLYISDSKTYLYPIRPNTKCASCWEQWEITDFIWTICSNKESLKKTDGNCVGDPTRRDCFKKQFAPTQNSAIMELWSDLTRLNLDKEIEAIEVLAEYNSDLYEIALRLHECRIGLYASNLNPMGRKKVFDYLLAASTYFYFEKENLNNDFNLIEEGMNLMIDNPVEFLNSDTGSIEFSKDILTNLAEEKAFGRELV